MKVDNLTLLACLSLSVGGCILMPDNDDEADDSAGFETDDSDDESDGDTEAVEEDDSDGDTGSSGGADTDDDAGSTGADTEGDDLECSDNMIVDPGFEAGSPNEMWEEASALFGTPLCDESCTTDAGAEPHGGDWWIWFGGTEEPEQASMRQTVTFDADHAKLAFYFSINSAAGTGDDVFSVRMDDEVVFTATDEDLSKYDGYTLVEVDVTKYADGAEHALVFEADISGEGLTNFFLDDVSLVECDDAAGESSGEASSDSGESSGGETDGAETEGDATEGDATEGGATEGAEESGG